MTRHCEIHRSLTSDLVIIIIIIINIIAIIIIYIIVIIFNIIIAIDHTPPHDDDDDQEPVWVDTVGWDDAEIGDDQTFREILTFIDK